MDIYQERYLKAQARKKESLASKWGTKKFITYNKEESEALSVIMSTRRSQRNFNSEPINEEDLSEIETAILSTPSSCDRRGVSYKIIKDRKDKELLSGILVGGVGWCHRADTIILLFADMDAYKNPEERSFMPYLDAGVIVQTAYLMAEVLNIGCCYINPHIREENREFFKQRFGVIFCGALALGHYNLKAIK